jgi:membrane protein DedA with SNARE-associated domain
MSPPTLPYPEQTMAEWTLNLMNSLGYLGVVLLMILENLFPPLPSELILPAAGFAAARGELNLIGVVLAGALGSVLGTLPLYFIGRAVGEERLVKWADRYGRWLTLSGRDIRKADDWFDRHGPKAVLFGRMVPGIRSLLSLPAGMSEMPLPKFLVYSAIGSGLWAALLATAGYLLGDNYEQVEGYVGPIGTALLVLLVGFAVVWVWRRRQAGKAQPE